MENVYVVMQHTNNPDWDIAGIFEKEQDAIDCCYDEDCYVAIIPFNKNLGKNIEYAKGFWPFQEGLK